MKSVVLCISYYRLFALWPTTDAREYFEGIVIDLTIEQLYNRGARRKSRRISAPSASRTRTGRRGGRARLSGPRPEYVVGHKLAALPRLCTRASRHVHHHLFFCARTAFGSGCRPIHHPSKGRVQSVESPNLLVDTIEDYSIRQPRSDHSIRQPRSDHSIRQPRSDRSSCRRRRDSPRVRLPASLSRHSAPRRAPSG